MLAELLSNPLLCIAVIIIAIIVGWILKVSKKIIFWIICLGIAYFLLTTFIL